MIQLVFESTEVIHLEAENGQRTLTFYMSPGEAHNNPELHDLLELAGIALQEDQAVGRVVLHYEGDAVHKLQLVLELPDAAWDSLANCADDLLDEDMLSDEFDDELFDEEDLDEEF